MKPIRRITAETARERARRAAAFLARDPTMRLVFLFGSAADPNRREVRDVDVAFLARYEDVLEQLALHGVIERALSERFRGLGGFRNILVHDYLRLDPAKVAENAERAPRDLSAFARAIDDWLMRIGV